MLNYIKKSEGVQNALWAIVFIIIWQLFSTLNITNKYLLPPFSDVIKEMLNQIRGGMFLRQIVNSFIMIISGFSVSIFLAAIIVILCNRFKAFESMIRAICVILTPLPGVAVMPLIIMVFGIRENAMIVLMIHSVLWPLVINLLGGIKAIPPIYTEFGLNLELNSLEMVKSIYLFSLMPCIISGLRIGWGRAWRALISAEMVFGMIGELGGIGYFIYTNRAYGNMTRVMVGVLAVIIMGIFIESFIFGVLEKMTIVKWGMKNE